MEDLIFDLNDWARELLAKAIDLENEIGDVGENTRPDQERLGRIKALLGAMCEALTGVEKVLKEPTGPLERLIQRVDGAKVCADATKENLDRFLTSHKRMLQNIGVPERMVNELINALDLKAEENKGGSTRLDEPQTLTREDLTDEETFLKHLGELRACICEIHDQAEIFTTMWDPKLPKACIKGVMGACLVVVDITGALTAPDITGFVLVKAVKSTWSGYNLVKNSVEVVNSLWKNLKNSVDSARRREQLRNRNDRGRWQV